MLSVLPSRVIVEKVGEREKERERERKVRVYDV